MITDCGLLGKGGRRSIITFLGGGGIFLPEIVIIFFPFKNKNLIQKFFFLNFVYFQYI